MPLFPFVIKFYGFILILFIKAVSHKVYELYDLITSTFVYRAFNVGTLKDILIFCVSADRLHHST